MSSAWLVLLIIVVLFIHIEARRKRLRDQPTAGNQFDISSDSSPIWPDSQDTASWAGTSETGTCESSTSDCGSDSVLTLGLDYAWSPPPALVGGGRASSQL